MTSGVYLNSHFSHVIVSKTPELWKKIQWPTLSTVFRNEV